MGVIQFHVERPDLLSTGSALSLVDFQLYDGRIIPARAALKDSMLICERATSESGQMRILWPRFDGRSQVMQTTSLREQQEPYQLELELARGQLSRLRNQLNAWQSAGLQVSPQLHHLVTDSHRAFRAAVLRTEAPEVSAGAAMLSVDLSARASELLCQHYTEQRLSFRRNRTSRLPVFLGCHLTGLPDDSLSFDGTFNAVQVDASWDCLEHADGAYDWSRLDALVAWAQERRLFVIGGPLIDLTVDRFPGWMKQWKGDFVNLQSFSADFVETVVGRYVGRIRHWEVAVGANRGGSAGLDEEQRLNLMARVVDAARQVDEHTLISLRVVQPWGEYLGTTSNRLSPMQFVDTLRRCGVRLAEVNIELRVGPTPGTGLWRDGLALSQLLDQWSLMQLPINVMLAPPIPPPESRNEFEVTQVRWMRETIMTCLAKERVVGIYCLNWNLADLNDRAPALVSANGTPLTTFKLLQQLSDEYWT